MARLKQMPRRFGRMPGKVRALPKVADRFYTSNEWRKLVAAIKRERGAWCEVCGAGGKGVRIIGDHKQEIRDGGAKLDPINVELLCASCHNVKTAEAKAVRVTQAGGGSKSGGPAAL